MTYTAVRFFAFALVALTKVAWAADTSGQFPGVYVLQGTREPVTVNELEAVQLKCLLAPSVMREGGFGIGYFLDTELFRKTGSISYIKGQEYHCRFSSETRKETCESKEFSDGKSLTYYRNNVYEIFTRELQRGYSLLTPEEVVAWNSDKTVNPESGFSYRRCNCLKSDEVEAAASTQLNRLSSEETGRRLFWWDSEATDEELGLAGRVRAKFGDCRSATS